MEKTSEKRGQDIRNLVASSEVRRSKNPTIQPSNAHKKHGFHTRDLTSTLFHAISINEQKSKRKR